MYLFMSTVIVDKATKDVLSTSRFSALLSYYIRFRLQSHTFNNNFFYHGITDSAAGKAFTYAFM